MKGLVFDTGRENHGPARTGNGVTDEDLVQRVRAGDEGAFDSVVALYEKPVRSLLYRLIRDDTDAEDMAQETFLKVYTNLHQYRGAASLKTWIFRIATNLAMDWHRSRGREPNLVRLDDPARERMALKKTEGPLERAQLSEQKSALNEALLRLPMTQRAALVLKVTEGMKYEEIARVLNTTEKSVKSSIHVARKKMAESMRGYFE
jgi:RNA polymerase sigma-70 factor (ECF subfamily)